MYLPPLRSRIAFPSVFFCDYGQAPNVIIFAKNVKEQAMNLAQQPRSAPPVCMYRHYHHLGSDRRTYMYRGYLTHKKPPPPRTPREGGVYYERGTLVLLNPASQTPTHLKETNQLLTTKETPRNRKLNHWRATDFTETQHALKAGLPPLLSLRV